MSLILAIVDLVNSGKPFTDIHIEQDSPMMWKTPAGWQETGVGITGIDDMEPLLDSLEKDWRQALDRGASIDRPRQLTNSRLRCNVFSTRGGEKVVVSIRKHPLLPPSLVETGLPPHVAQLLNWSKGLIVVTGSTGSGKTTTIASMIDHLNQNRASHIVTIEQPIEFVIERKRCIVSQKEVPVDVAGFDVGLRDALRQKPDVIMIGEVRDRETADTMLHAAESGHLVLATLHTNSADGAIAKLLSFFPPDEMASRAATLANSLIGIICQALVPRQSCDSFILASEILVNTPQTAKLISDPAKLHLLRDVLRRGDDKLSRHLNTVLIDMLKRKEVTRDAAMRASHAPLELQDSIQRMAL